MGGCLRGLAVLAWVAAAGVGCVRLGGPGDVHRDVRAITGERYEKEFGLTVGRTGMAIARWSLRHGDDPDVPSLEGVRKVEIGVYERRPARGPSRGGRDMTAADWPGWFPMVEMHSGPDNVLVLSEEMDLDIRRLMILVEDDEELVIVRLTGELGGFLEGAFALAFQEAERPELADPAMAWDREHGGHGEHAAHGRHAEATSGSLR
jgi:hypothetical protein